MAELVASTRSPPPPPPRAAAQVGEQLSCGGRGAVALATGEPHRTDELRRQNTRLERALGPKDDGGRGSRGNSFGAGSETRVAVPIGRRKGTARCTGRRVCRDSRRHLPGPKRRRQGQRRPPIRLAGRARRRARDPTDGPDGRAHASRELAGAAVNRKSVRGVCASTGCSPAAQAIRGAGAGRAISGHLCARNLVWNHSRHETSVWGEPGGANSTPIASCHRAELHRCVQSVTIRLP
jgi:hypothetical protein